MHLKRLLTAAVVLPLMYLYIVKLPPVYYAALVFAMGGIAQSEFYSMYKVGGALRAAGTAAGVLVLALMFWSPGYAFDAVAFSFLVLAVIRLFSKRTPGSSLLDLAPVVVGLVYIPAMLGYQMSLRRAGAEWIIFLYGTIWISDSFAFYIGRSVGRRTLYREVSPKKTVEGAIGSLLGGVISAVVIRALFIESMAPGTAALLGLALGAVAVIGDLVESMFKRDAGVKDSSSLIPGHGGLLDKIDGSLFGGPALLWILQALRIITV